MTYWVPVHLLTPPIGGILIAILTYVNYTLEVNRLNLKWTLFCFWIGLLTVIGGFMIGWCLGTIHPIALIFAFLYPVHATTYTVRIILWDRQHNKNT